MRTALLVLRQMLKMEICRAIQTQIDVHIGMGCGEVIRTSNQSLRVFSIELPAANPLKQILYVDHSALL